jgi:hypothetical protein
MKMDLLLHMAYLSPSIMKKEKISESKQMMWILLNTFSALENRDTTKLKNNLRDRIGRLDKRMKKYDELIKLSNKED